MKAVIPCLVALMPSLLFAGVQLGTWNIRGSGMDHWAAPGQPTNWVDRMGVVCACIDRHEFELLGLQECSLEQSAYIRAHLKGWTLVGVAPEEIDEGAGKWPNPIIYRTDRFKLLDWGRFVLSETPHLSLSRSWDSRGYFPDEAEYFGCKCAANDATVSVMGALPTDGPLAFAGDMQLTITGWWENLRYARAFKPGLQERMRTPGEEFRLRQDASGAWCVTPYAARRHRVATEDFVRWRETIRLAVSNDTADACASWARIVRRIPLARALKAEDVSSLWVKGDGSGAVVNFQLGTAPAYGRAFSENFVVLDFTGWRKVDLLLRERDADITSLFAWPYVNPHDRCTPGAIFRTPVKGRPLDTVSVYVNGIPKGGAACVEFGAWDSVPQHRGLLAANAVVSLNGKDFVLPFALPSGEYAELADGAWTHYAESGEPLERIAANARPQVKAGANELSFIPHSSSLVPHPSFPRVEVTVFPIGEGETATDALTAAQKRELAVEYELPRIFIPGKAGPENRTQISRREPLGEGVLENPIKVTGGTTHVTYSSEIPGSRVTFVKYYR